MSLNLKELLESVNANSCRKDEPATVYQVAQMLLLVFEELRKVPPVTAPEWVRPSDLARLLGIKSPSTASDLLNAAMAHGKIETLVPPSKKEGAKGNTLYKYADIIRVLKEMKGKRKWGSK